jgi:hypothetical protein
VGSLTLLWLSSGDDLTKKIAQWRHRADEVELEGASEGKNKQE